MNADKQEELVQLTTKLMEAQSALREADAEVRRAESHRVDAHEALQEAEWKLSAFYGENRP